MLKSGASTRLLIDAYSADYTSVVVGAGFVGNTSTETSGNFDGAGGQTNDGGSKYLPGGFIEEKTINADGSVDNYKYVGDTQEYLDWAASSDLQSNGVTLIVLTNPRWEGIYSALIT
jgi:hypothetical protein